MTTGRPGAAHLGLPFDVLNGLVDAEDVWGDATLGAFPARPTAPDPAAVANAAELLASARNPLFICGGGVVIAGAEAELQALAEALGAPVATTISGQGSIGGEHPLAVGVVGSNGGTRETRELAALADLVVFVGCRAGSVTTERWRYPAPGKTQIVHIDVDPGVIGATYRVDAALVGDARLALAALREALGATHASAGKALDAAAVARAKEKKFAAFRELAQSDETPIRPERIVAELQAVLPPDAILVADPGTPCPYFSAYFTQAAPGRQFISNRAHGALGYSMSAAVGAHVGRPGKKIVAVMGDGSFGFTAGELETITRLGVPLTMIVISNSGYQQRYFSVDFSRTDHAKVAAAFGVKSWRVEDPAALRGVLREAVGHAGPTLVDIIAQPLHEARAPVSEWVA
jgi:acetolactate synthase-1/2/3 large subunit